MGDAVNLLVALDHRFDRTPDGAVWSWFFNYAFWARYLEVFDAVRVMARVRDVSGAAAVARRADGDRVAFVPMPFYHGPVQYLRQSGAVRAAIRAGVRRDDAVILRSGQMGNCLAQVLRKDRHPYAMELIGDPYDVFAPGANIHPLRPFLRWWYPRQIRRLCQEAAAVAYVTEFALQQRYPAHTSAFSTHYSSIELNNDALVSAPRSIRTPVRNLLTIGTMDQPYKGHDVLLRALASAVRNGETNLTLTIAGDGRFRPSLEGLTRKLRMADRVAFLGQVGAGGPVRAQLDQADLFVLPSRTEGLPRALIEAMARAMPCVSTTVGGTPELLSPEDRVPAGDALSLARKLAEVVRDVPRLNRMSTRNLAKAREYRLEILQERRPQFYRHIKKATEDWLDSDHGKRC